MAITVNLDAPGNAVDELAQALANLRERGHTPRRSGQGWIARCPAHDDASASLSLAEGKQGGLVTHCHAGCTREAIWAQLGIPDRKPADASQSVRRNTPQGASTSHGVGRRIVATYPYVDEQGELLYKAIRYEPKDFRQCRPDGKGGWTYSLGDTRRVLYRLPDVLTAVARGDAIYVVEGEKDVEAIRTIGAVALYGATATCSPMGAGKWRDEYADALQGASAVIIIADNDAPGILHAQKVAATLLERDIPHVIKLPAHGKDAHDHLEHGLSLNDLIDHDPGQEPQPEPETLPEPQPAVEILNLDQLLRNPPPPPEWAWSEYIERGTLAVLHGDGGLGKSLIGMGLCRRYTLQREWLTHDTQGGDALYLDGENSLHEIARRLYSFEVRPGEQHLHYGRVSIPILLHPDAGETLLADLIERTQSSLLVLDSQRALWGGDEKEALEVRPMYAMLARLAERLNTAILLIHHDNKSGLYSGSTDINAAVVSRLHLERKNPKNRKDRRRVLWHEKSRSGPEADDVTFSVDKTLDGRLTFQIHEEDEDDQATESVRIPRDTTRTRILTLLADRVPRKRHEAARELGFDAANGTLRRAWEELIQDGSIVPTETGTYTLA